MGCSPSRILRTKRKSIKRAHRRRSSESLILSKFQNNSEAVDDYYLLALSSRSYGVVSLDNHALDDPLKDTDPVNEIYQKMKNLDANGSIAPESWSEVSRMLSQIKFEVEQTTSNPPSAADAKPEGELIDVRELMEDLEQEGICAARPSKDEHYAGEKHVIALIHTIEELDKVAEPLPLASSSSNMFSAGTPGSISSAEIAYVEEDFVGAISRSPPVASTFAIESIGCEVGALDASSLAIKLSTRSPRTENHNLIDALKATSIAVTANLTNSNDQTRFERMVDESHGDLVPCDKYAETDDALFDPELLASFEEAFENISENDWYKLRENADASQEFIRRLSNASDSTLTCNNIQNLQTDHAGVIAERIQQFYRKITRASGTPSLMDKKISEVFDRFEAKCPPGAGSRSVVLYLTSLRGIRKTYEDCSMLKTLISQFGIEIDERDVSLHSEFKEELKALMAKTVSVPRLFIKGRYIGGVENVLQLHENGTLEELLKGIPTKQAKEACDGCGGVRFLPCPDCSGSCKVLSVKGAYKRCSDCNENGLVLCPICS